MILKGNIVSGLGDFSKRMEQIPGLLDAYFQLTGQHFSPGTLNVELAEEFSLPVEKIIRLEAEAYKGTVSVNILPCKLFDLEVFILRTDKNEAGKGHHPKTIIEIASQYRLRDKFNLVDGDELRIKIEE